MEFSTYSTFREKSELREFCFMFHQAGSFYEVELPLYEKIEIWRC